MAGKSYYVAAAVVAAVVVMAYMRTHQKCGSDADCGEKRPVCGPNKYCTKRPAPEGFAPCCA